MGPVFQFPAQVDNARFVAWRVANAFFDSRGGVHAANDCRSSRRAKFHLLVDGFGLPAPPVSQFVLKNGTHHASKRNSPVLYLRHVQSIGSLDPVILVGSAASKARSNTFSWAVV